MRIFFIPIILIAIGACQTEREIINNLPTDAVRLENETERNIIEKKLRNEDYQLTSPSVELYIEPGKPVPDIEAHNNFIKRSGLPRSSDFNSWKIDHDLDKTLDLYKAFLQSNHSSPYSRFFRQHQSWLYITHFAILSKPGFGEQLKFLVNELIETNYKGYPLLFYSLNYLNEEASVSKGEINRFVSAILLYYEPSSSAVGKGELSPNTIQSGGKPMPPEVIALVNKRIREKSEEKQWIDRISQLK